MAQPSNDNVVEVKPQANVYTVMMLIAIIALVAAIVICGMKLTAPVADGGYAMTVSELLEPLK